MSWIPPVNIFKNITQPKALAPNNLLTPEEIERRRRADLQKPLKDNRNVLTHPQLMQQVAVNNLLNQKVAVAPPQAVAQPQAVAPLQAPTPPQAVTPIGASGNDPLYDIINNPDYRGISAYYADNNLDTTSLLPATTPVTTPATNGGTNVYGFVEGQTDAAPSANPDLSPYPTTPLTPEQILQQQQRDNIIKQLQYQQRQLTQQALDAQNEVDTQSKIRAKNFAEYLAQRGLNAPDATSGVDTQYRMINDVATRQALTDIDLQKQTQIQELNLQAQQNLTNLDLANYQSEQEQEALDAQNKNVADTNDKNAWLDTFKLRFYDPTGTTGGYMGEINRINALLDKGDVTEAWKIPYLEAARAEKLMGQADAAKDAEALAIKNYNTRLESERKNALNVWRAMGIANKWVAKILGIAVGQKTVAYINAELANDRIQLSKYKAAQAANKSGGGGGGSDSGGKKLTRPEARQSIQTFIENKFGREILGSGMKPEQRRIIFNYINSLNITTSDKKSLFKTFTTVSYDSMANKIANTNKANASYKSEYSKLKKTLAGLTGAKRTARVFQITRTKSQGGNAEYYKKLLGDTYYNALVKSL